MALFLLDFAPGVSKAPFRFAALDVLGPVRGVFGPKLHSVSIIE
jgi:hypothetical protein